MNGLTPDALHDAARRILIAERALSCLVGTLDKAMPEELERRVVPWVTHQFRRPDSGNAPVASAHARSTPERPARSGRRSQDPA